MADNSLNRNLTVDLVDEYKNFWPRTTERRCDDFYKRLLLQINAGMKEFKHEMHCFLEAINRTYSCENEREAIQATVKPMMLKRYIILYEIAIALQSVLPSNAVSNSEDAYQPVARMAAGPLDQLGETGTDRSSVPVHPSPPAQDPHIRADPEQMLADGPSSPIQARKGASRESQHVPSQVQNPASVSTEVEVRGAFRKSEVEKRAWIFSSPKFGEGYFVLRCGTAEDPVYFDRDPLSYNRAGRHFSADIPCHDIKETEHFSIDEIIRRFGYRVDGVDSDFVTENNGWLRAATEMSTADNRKRKPVSTPHRLSKRTCVVEDCVEPTGNT